MNPNPIAIELKAMANRLRELFPESQGITLSAVTHTDRSLTQSISLHQIGDYEAGSQLLRRVGIGNRRKRVMGENSPTPWTALHGSSDDVEFTAFCSTIPPSCRVETVTKRIPKTATVDTGEFIEVQERVVKCGQPEAVA